MYTSMYIFTYVYDIDIYAYTTYILTWCAARGDREGYIVASAKLPPRALGQLAACKSFVRPFKFMYFLCAAVCCSVLQCVGVCWSVLECVAVCCSVLHCKSFVRPFKFMHFLCAAVCCSVL